MENSTQTADFDWKRKRNREPLIGNLYPNSCFRPEKVEKPGAADWKTLPKQPISTGKGRETGSRRLEISTQTAVFAGKGRESVMHLPFWRKQMDKRRARQ